MFRVACALLCMVHFSFSMLQDEIRGLSTKPLISTISAHPSAYVPQLLHAVQNHLVISQLTTPSTQYVRTINTKTQERTYSARFLRDNTAWIPFIAEKSFYELIAKYQLVDRKPEDILKSCRLSTNHKS